MSKELARRFAPHQGYSRSGAVQAPSIAEMIARAMQAFTDGDLPAYVFMQMLETFALYQDNEHWAAISPSERALLMADGMQYRTLLVAMERDKLHR